MMIFFFVSCRNHPGDKPPTLELIKGGNYIYKDTVLKAGTAFLFGIVADKGDNDLTNLQVRRVFNGGEQMMIDTGIHNEKFVYSCQQSTGTNASEVWYFRILDDEGQWTEVSFTLTIISAFDSVRFLPSVILGAQQCTTHGSFYDLRNDTVYFQHDAFSNQDSIEMLYYYDNTGWANTIASPGANIDSMFFPGPDGIDQWTPDNRNETRYIITNISTSVFDAVVYDSLLIAEYNSHLHYYRKAKNLVTGNVYSFRTTTHGKFGLFKVVNVVGAETGTIEISIKVQR
jgi:hypothetical protein